MVNNTSTTKGSTMTDAEDLDPFGEAANAKLMRDWAAANNARDAARTRLINERHTFRHTNGPAPVQQTAGGSALAAAAAQWLQEHVRDENDAYARRVDDARRQIEARRAASRPVLPKNATAAEKRAAARFYDGAA